MQYVAIGESTYELKVLNSRFVCFSCELSSESKVNELIELFKKTYSKADHYPYAYKIGTNSKSSDDGEPSGTAGRQMLELLGNLKLTNVLVVIARYFGGCKLGAGRLTRTFVECSKQSLVRLQKGVVTTYKKQHLILTYQNYELLKKISMRNNIILQDIVFEDTVKATILIPNDVVFEEKDYKISYIDKKEDGLETIIQKVKL